NFFPGEVRRDGSVQLAGGFVTAPIKRHPLTPEEATTYAVSGDAVVAVRPEHLVISEVTHPLVPAPDAATAGLPGRVRRVLFLGSITRYFVVSEDSQREVMVESARPVPGIQEGMGVVLSFGPAEAIAYLKDAA